MYTVTPTIRGMVVSLTGVLSVEARTQCNVPVLFGCLPFQFVPLEYREDCFLSVEVCSQVQTVTP